jgi:hypothetical protein
MFIKCPHQIECGVRLAFAPRFSIFVAPKVASELLKRLDNWTEIE